MHAIQRDDLYKKRLIDCIRCEYGISATFLAEANRGFYAETWRLDSTGSSDSSESTKASRSCFLKINYSSDKETYANNLPVIEHLHHHGVNAISSIVKTADNRLFTEFDGAVLAIFDWIDGENIQDESTKIPEYRILGKVYSVPADELLITNKLTREDFTADSASLFLHQWAELKKQTDKCTQHVSAILDEHREQLIHNSERLKLLSIKCRLKCDHFYITHGDAGANIIKNGNSYYLVDWDNPLLAPVERDAWFCLYWGDWALSAFTDSLRDNGIEYSVRNERMAYYGYHNYFFRLTEYMKTYFSSGQNKEEIPGKLQEFFKYWIDEEIKRIDGMK